MFIHWNTILNNKHSWCSNNRYELNLPDILCFPVLFLFFRLSIKLSKTVFFFVLGFFFWTTFFLVFTALGCELFVWLWAEALEGAGVTPGVALSFFNGGSFPRRCGFISRKSRRFSAGAEKGTEKRITLCVSQNSDNNHAWWSKHKVYTWTNFQRYSF